MFQHNVDILLHTNRVILAFKAIKKMHAYVKLVAASYTVRRSTFHDRRVGMTTRHDCQANSARLTEYEEDELVQHIRKLN
jgi:hypothetical protein